MKHILKDALLKLARNEGQAAYVLDTEFGGGKTHTILLLYHIFRNRDLGTEYIKKIGLDESGVLEVPDVNVVALDCINMRKKTLWGEIAYALGRYDDVREYDEQLKAISNLETIKRLFDKPTLLLIDELPVYLLNADSQTLGNVTLADLTIAFIQTLISAISSTMKNMLILTLTGEQRLYAKYSEKGNFFFTYTNIAPKEHIPLRKFDEQTFKNNRIVVHIDYENVLVDFGGISFSKGQWRNSIHSLRAQKNAYDFT